MDEIKINSDKTEAKNSNDTNSLTTFQLNYLTMIYPHLIVLAIYVLSSTVTLAFTNTFPIYASHAFTTYVISAEFGVTYLYPLLRQYKML